MTLRDSGATKQVSPKPAGKGGRLTNPHDRPSRKATHIYSQLNRILSGHEAKNRNRSKTRYKYHSNVEKMENIYICDKMGKKRGCDGQISKSKS